MVVQNNLVDHFTIQIHLHPTKIRTYIYDPSPSNRHLYIELINEWLNLTKKLVHLHSFWVIFKIALALLVRNSTTAV